MVNESLNSYVLTDRAVDRLSIRRPVVLVAGSDENYAEALCVSLCSALSRLPRDRAARAYVLDGGLSSRSLGRLRVALTKAHPSVEVAVIRPDVASLPRPRVKMWFNEMVFLRLLVPELLPPDLDRALYIDSDTVTVEDVSPLFDMNLGEHALWAVRDSGQAQYLAYLKAAVPEFDPPDGAVLFNSGVLLIDLIRWRKEKITERAFDVFSKHEEKLNYFDQDALNIVFSGSHGKLDDKWNNCIAFRKKTFPELFEGGAIRGILHFVGPKKPWLRGAPCFRSEVYFSVLSEIGYLDRAEAWKRRLHRAFDVAKWPFVFAARKARDAVKRRWRGLAAKA